MDAKKIISILEKRFVVTDLPLESIQRYLMEFKVENALNSYLNDDKNLSAEDLDFCVYKIERTKESEIYFSEQKGYFADVFFDKQTGEPILIAVIEKNTGYYSVNSSLLFLELNVEIGISEDDKKHNTLRYQEYIGSKQLLKKLSNFGGV